MSLFGIRNWWQKQCPDLDENYDIHNLLCARFGAQNNETSDYIVTSSHGGFLSIFYPSAEVLQKGGVAPETNHYRETDILYETRFETPVLGTYAGKFTSNINANELQNINQLVVLHPYSVDIYKVNMVLGVAEHGSQMSLQAVAKYQLSRVAFDFCQGHFGRVEGRDFFCVSHIDGSLSFFEQDGISYQCQFPNCSNILSPIVYCDNSDCFIRFTSTWILECYRYQDLAQSSLGEAHYEPIWSLCLGECILDMRTVRAKSDADFIMILGEHNFFILQDNGKLEKTLKLDYVPKCFHSFIVGYYWEPNARLITAIVSKDSRLHIYEGIQLIWAAKHEELDIVALQRANITGLAGCIVTLGSCGRICLGYLGTRPFVFEAPPMEVETTNLNDSYAQMLELEQQIKDNMDVQNISEINKKAYEDVRVHFTISDEVIESNDDMLMELSAAVVVNEFYSATAQLRFKCYIDIAELQLTFDMPEAIKCSVDTTTYLNLTTGSSQNLELKFYIAELLHVATTQIVATISYITNQGLPRVINHSAKLPLRMFYKVASAQKTAGLRLTLNHGQNVQMPMLVQLLPEFVDSDADVQSLGLELLLASLGSVNPIVTIIRGDDMKRLRIQSDTLEALAMIVEHILNKMAELHEVPTSLVMKKEKNEKSDIFITVTHELLSTSILQRLTEHHKVQFEIRQLTTTLDDLWQKYKDMQKQTQENYELVSNDTQTLQMEEMYDRFILEGDKLTALRKDEQISQCNLNCAISLVKLLLGNLNVEEKDSELISAVLCTPIVDWQECSWEEGVYPGLEMLSQKLKLMNKDGQTKELNVVSDQFDFERFRILLANLLEGLLAPVEVKNKANKIHQQQSIKKPTHPLLYSENLFYPLENPLPSIAAAVVPTTSSEKLKKVEERETKPDNLLIDNKVEDLCEIDKLSKEQVAHAQQGQKQSNEQIQKEEEEEQEEEEEESEWVNENYKLPTSDELFNDLGIWW